jgi:ankyrin repeat domain-containing protein 50
VCECVSEREVRRTLKTFPLKIEDVYLQSWDRILKQNEEHISLAKAVLVWVINAARPMTLDELERAIATCPDTYRFQPDRLVPGATLISLCRGLVTVEEESRIVRLARK